MISPRVRTVIVVAGLALLAALLFVPRPGKRVERRPAAPAPRPVAAAAEEPEPPAHVPWAARPPKKAERAKPAANPLEKVAQGIMAAPGGSAAAPYVLRDRNASAFFTPKGLTLALAGRPMPGSGPSERRGYALQWGLVGAAEVQPRAEGEMAGKVHSYVGDPSTWKENQSSYSSIVYEDVRPGVDMTVESRPSGVKYTLHAERGADLAGLRFRYAGAHSLQVAEDGASVEVDAGVGTLRENGLHCWQDGPEGRRNVSARYVARGANEVEISLGEMDPDRPLTVDPVISWSTYLGGSVSPLGEDYGYSVAADTSGNIYVAGYTYSVDFPAVGGGFSPTLQGTVDGFLIKLSSSGLQWATYLGGTSADYAYAVAVDGGGNPVVVGYTVSSDFPTTVGAYDRILNNYETFVMKFGSGGGLAWSTFLGGTSSDYGQAVAVDTSGNVIVGGYTYSSNFPIVGGFDPTSATTPDGFVAKLNSTGSSLLYSTYLGGNDTDLIYGVAVDTLGSIFAAGYTYSTDFTAAGIDTTIGGTVDGFLAKISSAGGLAWATYLGGTNTDYLYGVTVTTDAAQDPVVVGYTNSVDYPFTVGAYDTLYNGTDVVVTKVKSDGTGYVYSTFLGGTSSDFGQGIAPGPTGSVFVTGYTFSSNYPTTAGAYRTVSIGLPDGFVTQLNSAGSALVASTFIGGTSSDYPRSIAVVPGGASPGVYIGGNTYSNNYPSVPVPPLDNSLGGITDAFASKLTMGLTSLPWSSYVGGHNSLGDDFGQDVTVDPSGSAYVTGYTTSIDFPVQFGVLDFTLGGTQDVFVMKVTTDVSGFPFVEWSTFLGGSSTESAFSICVDSLNFPYITGHTSSADFPLGGSAPGPDFDTTLVGTEAFATCLNPSGTLFYSTFLGGSSSDYGRAIAVDSSFNAYITGYTYSSNFPTLAPFDGTLAAGPDAFVVKLNVNGGGVWSSYLGGNSDDYGYCVTADDAGTVYVTGYTYSSDFSSSGIDNTLGGSVDAFVAKVNTGGTLAWTRYLGGASSDYGHATTVDPAGTFLYVTGYTHSNDFPTANAYDATLGTSPDAFVSRINVSTGALTWSTYLGGNSSDYGYDVDTDAAGNVFVTGYTYSSDFPMKGAVDPTINGSADAFAVKMYAAGGVSSLAWSTFLGGNLNDFGYGISWSSNDGSVYVSGTTYSTNFPIANELDDVLDGNTDAFVVRLDRANPDEPDFSAVGAGIFRLNGSTPIPFEGWTNEASIIIKGKLADSDDEQVKVQVEIKDTDTDFSDLGPFSESPFVASGALASVTVPLPGSPPREYHLRARTVDSTGRVSSWTYAYESFNGDLPLPAGRDLGRDTGLPTVAVTTPATLTFHTQSGTIALDGTADDLTSGVVSVTWSRLPALPLPNNGPAFGTDSWNIPSVGLAVGTNTITIQATDAAGNVGQTVLTVIRDNTAPSVSITAPPATTIATNSITLNGTASDAAPGQLLSVTWGNDRGGNGNATLGPGVAWSALISPLSPGANLITVTAEDFAGNKSSATITITYDDTNPSVTIFAPVTGTVTQAPSIAMNGSAFDNLSLVSVNLLNLQNGSSATTTIVAGGNWSSNSNLLLQPGNNVLQATATDSVGRTSTAAVTVFQDLTNPVVTITFPAEQPPAKFTTGAPYVSLSGTATDNRGVATITWSRTPTGLPPDSGDGTLTTVGSTSTTFSTPLIPLQSGDNTITVTLTDLAGRIHQDSCIVTYDNSAPSITVTNPVDNPHVQSGNGITLTGGATDPGGAVTGMTCTNTTTGTSFPVVPAPAFPAAAVTWSSTLLLQTGTNQIQLTATDGVSTTIYSLTIICDPSAPLVKVTGPTTSDDFYTGIASIVLTGTATDNRGISSLTATLDGAPAALTGVATWTTNTLPLDPGLNVFVITALDAAGNSHQDTLNIIYDPDQPDILINQPTVADSYITTSSTLSGPTALQGTASDPAPGLLQVVTWSNAANGTGGTATGTTAWSVASISLEPGANSITVVASDGAGNLKTDTILVYYDTQLPGLAITGPSSGPTFVTNLATVALEGTASDDVGIDKVEWINADAPVPAWVTVFGTTAWNDPSVSLVAGDNDITVRVTDVVGGQTSQLITIHYDPNAPSLGVTVPGGMGTTSTTTTPYDTSGTASDLTGSGVAVEVSQVVWRNLTTGGSGTASLTLGAWTAAVPLTSGTNDLEFTAYDAAGNTTTVTRTCIYDPAAPFVEITTPTTDLNYTTGATPAVLGGTATDDVGVVSVSWTTTGAVVPNSGTADFTLDPNWTASIPLAPGSNLITVTATDGVGRIGTARITIVYDPTPPAVAITSPTADPTYITTITPLALAGAASDNLEVVEVLWLNETTGEGGPAQGTGAWSIAGINLIEGPNLITITATDGVGNQGTASITVTYDGTAPTISVSTIDGSPATNPFPTSTRPLDFAGVAGDNLSLSNITWTNSLGGGGSAVPTPALPAASVTWTASVYLFPGSNVITFTATDAHGYTATAQVTVPFTPESTAPTIVITAPSASGSAVSATQIVTVGGTADDNVGVIEVSWRNLTTGVRGGALLSGGPNPIDWTADIPLTNGVNVIVATALDDAGNTATAAISITFTSPSDAVPPAITITGPTLLDVWDENTSPIFLTMAVLDNVGIASVRFSNAATGGDGVGEFVLADTWGASVPLAQGANTITVTAYDPAGNTATDTLVVNFIPAPGDGANPVVTITSHPTGATLPWSSSTIDLAGIASDNVAVATVVWLNNASTTSGSADGTNAWAATLLLVPGANVVTMRTYDTSGNTDTDQITILYTPPPLPPEYVPGGHCGLLGLDGLAVMALIALLRRRRR